MFKNLLFLRIFVCFSAFMFASHSFAQAEFYVNFGAGSIGYHDQHLTQTSSSVEFTNYLLNTELGAKLPLGTRLLALSADVQVLNPTLSTASQSVTFLNYNARAIFKIPSQPFNVDLIAEYFSDSITPSASTFGYDNMSGIRYLAALSAFVPRYRFAIELYYPLTHPVPNVNVYDAKLIYFFEIKDGKAKEVVKEGSFFKIGYQYKRISDTSDASDTVVTRVRSYIASFGVYF